MTQAALASPTYLCTTDDATGFSEDAQNDHWVARPVASGEKFIIRVFNFAGLDHSLVSSLGPNARSQWPWPESYGVFDYPEHAATSKLEAACHKAKYGGLVCDNWVAHVELSDDLSRFTLFADGNYLWPPAVAADIPHTEMKLEFGHCKPVSFPGKE